MVRCGGQCTGSVAELATDNRRQLIVDVFPVAQLERHEISYWRPTMHARCQRPGIEHDAAGVSRN